MISRTGTSPDPHVPKKRAVVSQLELSHSNSFPRQSWNNVCLNFKMPADIIITQGMFLKMKHITMAETLKSGQSHVFCVGNVPTVTQKVTKTSPELPRNWNPTLFICHSSAVRSGNFCKILWWDQNLPCSLFKLGKKPGLSLAFLSKQQQIFKIKESLKYIPATPAARANPLNHVFYRGFAANPGEKAQPIPGVSH